MAVRPHLCAKNIASPNVQASILKLIPILNQGKGFNEFADN